MTKKKIPLRLLEIIEPFLKDNADIITVSSDDNFYYIIKDNEPGSDFFISIYRSKPKTMSHVTKAELFLERKPNSKNSLHQQTSTTNYAEVLNSLKEWADIVRQYNETDSALDDPIVKAYQKEYFTEYEIIDDDANYAPFNDEQLFFLDSHLETITNNIDNYKTSENAQAIEEIKSDSEKLRSQLTALSKKKVLKKLTTIWAKMKKQGLKLTKEFVNEGKKEFFKYIIKKAIEIGTGVDTGL
jgi:hypothetical protein